MTILRITQRLYGRPCRQCGRRCHRDGSGHCLSRGPATACRRVFQKQFAESLRLADEVVVTEVHRKDIPESERLSERELVADLSAAGVAARFVPTVDDVVAVVVEDAQPGDQIIAMSNGGFGGIHDRLLAALAAR